MATLTTPRLAIPYPDGTERVMDGDNAMGAIATKVDGLGLAYAMAVGSSNIVAPGGAASAAVSVTFPVGRFTQPPIVIANVALGTINYVTNVGTPTTSGFTATIFHNTAGTNVGANTYPIHWHAVQMLPGAAPG